MSLLMMLRLSLAAIDFLSHIEQW